MSGIDPAFRVIEHEDSERLLRASALEAALADAARRTRVAAVVELDGRRRGHRRARRSAGS